ncbi:MAG: ParA family protein [Gracilibacteraceae bacterium]|jgi:MinD-like ATPase involved in chromosome partitioning or flagellar assembly|nr:ParA family protein [Gracilibacteraceae bacterium]
MATKIVAVWGNPSSGKTVTAMKLARELEARKKNVIVICADLFCPALSALMPSVDVKGRTLGALLSRPHIKYADVMQAAIPYPKHERIAVIGYKNGDNIFTYSEFLAERVAGFLQELRAAADCVIIDCSSVLTEDGFTTIALQKADKVLRLMSADLKALSYYRSHLPLISRAKFGSGRHIKALSDLKAGQEESTFRSVYGGASYTLPHVKEIERQFYAAELLDALTGKEAKKYNAEIKKAAREVFELE